MADSTNFLEMTESVSLLSLFISSFLAATLLPGGSEVVLVSVLKWYPESFWPALMLGTLGNTLGGMVSFGMGWLLPQTQKLRHVEKIQRFGIPAVLFAWVHFLNWAKYWELKELKIKNLK